MLENFLWETMDDILKQKGFQLASCCCVFSCTKEIAGHLFHAFPLVIAVWRCLLHIFGMNLDFLGSPLCLLWKAMQYSFGKQVYSSLLGAIIASFSSIMSFLESCAILFW